MGKMNLMKFFFKIRGIRYLTLNIDSRLMFTPARDWKSLAGMVMRPYPL